MNSSSKKEATKNIENQQFNLIAVFLMLHSNAFYTLTVHQTTATQSNTHTNIQIKVLTYENGVALWH